MLEDVKDLLVPLLLLLLHRHFDQIQKRVDLQLDCWLLDLPADAEEVDVSGKVSIR